MCINEEISKIGGIAPHSNVRLIGADNEQIGIVPLSQALDMAYDKDLDLVLIAAQSEPAVCRIMDYGKFRFERDKKDKENKKKQQKVDIKEVQLSCKIDTNDFNTKVNHAKRFLTDGNKVGSRGVRWPTRRSAQSCWSVLPPPFRSLVPWTRSRFWKDGIWLCSSFR